MSLLLDVNNVRFTTTRIADEHCERLREQLGLRGRNAVARLAIAKSLSLGSAPAEIPAAEDSESGGAIKGDNLFGSDLATWVALLVQLSPDEPPSKKQIESLVRRHWRRGAVILSQELEAAGDHQLFLTRLAEAAAPEGRKGSHTPHTRTATLEAGPLVVGIGHAADVESGENLQFTLNAPGWAPHVAIMGGTGSGKSRTAKSFWRELRRQSPSTAFLIVDPKGDLGQDTALVEALGATVIRVQRNPVPLDVFGIGPGTDLIDASIRFSESLSRGIQGTLGAVQTARLQEAVQKSLRGSPPQTINKVQNQLAQAYATGSWKDDTLTAGLKQLVNWPLFEPKFTPSEFFGSSWILSLNEANDTVARLVVGLVTDALYNWMRPQADAPVDAAGHRAIRIVNAVDEAHQLLGRKQQSLSKLLKEGRSKGVSVMLMSQSPADFDAKDCNYLENIGLCLCFRTNVPATATLKSMWQAKVDTGGLERGVAVTRLPGEQVVRRLAVWE
jgi:DNA sulfur modification protein DndE